MPPLYGFPLIRCHALFPSFPVWKRLCVHGASLTAQDVKTQSFVSSKSRFFFSLMFSVRSFP